MRSLALFASGEIAHCVKNEFRVTNLPLFTVNHTEVREVRAVCALWA